MFENAAVYRVLDIVVNIVRPIPFIIFLAAMQPLTIKVVGTSIGTMAAVFPMVVMCTFATSRLVEQNLVPVDSGVIEAARSMGASKITIIRTVLIPEALAPLILAYAFLFIAVLDMSAMAGYIGGGGLGNFAIAYGYQKFDPTVTWTAVVIMIVLVQVVQGIANAFAKRLLKRQRSLTWCSQCVVCTGTADYRPWERVNEAAQRATAEWGVAHSPVASEAIREMGSYSWLSIWLSDRS